MSEYVNATFSDAVTSLLTQTEYTTARAVRLLHDALLMSAQSETNADTLIDGIYRLRHYLVEGGVLFQWLDLLSITTSKRVTPQSAIQREICCGWFLLLNDQKELAIDAYNRALQFFVQHECIPQAGQTDQLLEHTPQILQLEMDISVGMLFLSADQNLSSSHLEGAVEVWLRYSRYGSQEQEKRMFLALALLKLAAGMLPSGYANADDAYHFFNAREMNAEAGLAAFYLASYHAGDAGIDPATTPATGETLFWLHTAHDRWNSIGLPIGGRIIAPYIRLLDLKPIQLRPTRRSNDLHPPASNLN